MAKVERQYAVELLEKYQHGCYGKCFYFGLYVPGFSKKDAEEVALETVAGMSLNEIKERTVDSEKNFWGTLYLPNWTPHGDPTKPVGMEFAERFFTYKAYIE